MFLTQMVDLVTKMRDLLNSNTFKAEYFRGTRVIKLVKHLPSTRVRILGPGMESSMGLSAEWGAKAG